MFINRIQFNEIHVGQFIVRDPINHGMWVTGRSTWRILKMGGVFSQYTSGVYLSDLGMGGCRGRTCLWKLSGCWDGVILRDDFTQTNVAYGITLTGFYCQSDLEIQRSQTVLLLD